MTNIEVVQSLYAAFADRDRAGILAVLDPNVIWIQNEGFPGGGRHDGAEHVVDNVLARFSSDWSQWEAITRDYLDAGPVVVVLGEYRATHRATGRSTTAAFAHLYWVQNGRIVR